MTGGPEISEASRRDLADWERIAPGYLQRGDSPDGRILLQSAEVFWKVAGNVRRRRVLDTGCGPGWMTRALQDAGARVRGIDGAAEMLRLARAACPGIEFRRGDLSLGLPYPARSFDLILAHMLVLDIPDIAPLFRDVRRCLKRRGRFIFSMLHPCFNSFETARDEQTGRPFLKVTGYLDPAVVRRTDFEGGHNYYHRSLTDYVEALHACDLVVTSLVEPRTDPGADEPDPALRAFRSSVPRFVIVEARRV